MSLPKYWTETERAKLDQALTFSELVPIALAVIGRLPRPVVEVCGPLTTGGSGSELLNLIRFEQALRMLERRGFNVFDQLPFQVAMKRISATRPQADAWLGLLEQFYGPLFRSGQIAEGLYLPDWRSSRGACWERQVMADCGIITSTIPAEWLADCPAFARRSA